MEWLFISTVNRWISMIGGLEVWLLACDCECQSMFVMHWLWVWCVWCECDAPSVSMMCRVWVWGCRSTLTVSHLVYPLILFVNFMKFQVFFTYEQCSNPNRTLWTWTLCSGSCSTVAWTDHFVQVQVQTKSGQTWTKPNPGQSSVRYMSRWSVVRFPARLLLATECFSCPSSNKMFIYALWLVDFIVYQKGFLTR